jgi:biopolymer transport protein TolR
MGMSAGGGSGSHKSDMNVTPLVDIILVLLIIFMVTMPVLMRQITLEVPRQLEEHEVSVVASNQITATIHGDGTVTLQVGSTTEKVNRVELARTMRERLESKKTERVVFVDFDDELAYGEVVSAMDTIKGAGAEKVALKVREEGGPN